MLSINQLHKERRSIMVGHFLHAENSMFLIIDLQEKLMKKMKY